MSFPVNYYDLLGIPKDATSEEVRNAYHSAARKLHPDVSAEADATENFLTVQKAFDVLNDPEMRETYDEQLLAEIRSSQPVYIDILYSRPKLPVIDEPQLLYANLDFTPSEVPKKELDPSINICLVIDRSTSMRGERMNVVKEAAIELIQRLKSDDTLSIVVFSDRAEVLAPGNQSLSKKILENKIQMVQPGGGTEIYQGLKTGLTELKFNLNQSLINQIILLTDGHTYGDEDDCLQLADQVGTMGVSITGLGIGSEWNDIFLDDLAARTGGSSSYISDTHDIQRFLLDKFHSFGQIYADHITLSLDNEPDVELRSVFRLQPDSTNLPLINPIRLGSIPKTSKLSILLEFVLPPIKTESQRVVVASGKCNYVFPTNPPTSYTIPIHLSRFSGDVPEIHMPPQPIFNALSQIGLYRMQEQARADVVEGNYDNACLRLQHVATELFAMGQDGLAQTALLEVQHIRQQLRLSEDGKKQMKYGTRALLLPARVGSSIQ